MIFDLLEKTPDALLGTIAAGCLWFGFNHAVLAERAMKEVVQREVIPACIGQLERDENAAPINNIPQIRIPGIENNPLGGMLETLINKTTSGYRLTAIQRQARCLCATQSLRSLKFDYAVHTASFRLIKAESVGGLRSKSMKLVQSQACGALPWLNIGR